MKWWRDLFFDGEAARRDKKFDEVLEEMRSVSAQLRESATRIEIAAEQLTRQTIGT